MKNITIIVLLILELSINEFTLKFLLSDNSMDFNSINKIRYFNLIILVTLIIFYFYYENLIKIRFTSKISLFILYIVLIDLLSGYVDFGYKKSENESYRHIFPYDWIRGEPNKLDHNEHGFRGKSPSIERNNTKIIIGFFGGSTGYGGNPTIIEIVSKNLNQNEINNDVINFSSVSSNHNQHLHRLLEFSEYSYDIIIFYGGGNETIQHYYYDPRPGYPYNFYLYDNNSNSIMNFFIKYSNLIGEIDKLYNLYLDFNPKTSNDEEFGVWIKKTKKNYFDTIKKSKNLTKNMINPNKCKKAIFLPIFQPIKPTNDRTKKLVDSVRFDLKKNDIYDFSNLIDKLNFKDFVHVDQDSKKIIADKIYLIIKDLLINKSEC